MSSPYKQKNPCLSSLPLCIGKDEQLGKSVYNALEIHSGDFVLIYEWVLHWQKKMGKFLTTHELEKIEKCKKQVMPLFCIWLNKGYVGFSAFLEAASVC